MKNQTFRMTMLFDFYGELLTERQKEFYELYYDEDLSLSEIAENYGISRQGVRDVIVRAEAYMTEIEDKTGLVKRFMQRTPHLERIEAAADELRGRLTQRLEEAAQGSEEMRQQAERVELARLWSANIEYSEENMRAVLEELT